MQEYIGRQIDRYRVIERQGMGGMAIVYHAYDTRLERDVALKLIRTDNIPQSQQEQLLKRFEREAKAQGKFSHPHIVPIFDYGEVDGTPYLVMDYVRGGTLKQLTGQPLPFRQALHLVIPIADALRYAHARGVIHRDVKPGNILLNEEQQPLLTDFGIAKLLETDEATLTQTGVGMGTPEYMAPEQWHGKSLPQTDIYALGVVFYELVTGVKPYKADTPAAVAILQATEALPRPASFVAGLPQPLENIIYKAMAHDPKDRYESMEDMQRAMQSLLNESHSGLTIEAIAEQTLFVDRKNAEEGVFSQQSSVSPIASNVTIMPTSNIDKTELIANETEILQPSITVQQLPDQPKKRPPAWLLWGAIGAILLAFLLIGVFVLSRVLQRPEPEEIPLAIANTQTSTAIPQVEETPSPTSSPTISISPTATITRTFTPTHTSTPTPEVFLAMIREVDGMEMILIPGGTFVRGSDMGEDDEQPVRVLYVDDFWIDKYEVSNAQYQLCVSAGACRAPASRDSGSREVYYGNDEYDDYPVIYMSWQQADSYCRWTGGRLPTEAEWEKAARGIDERTYPWGEGRPSCDLANYYGCVGDTSAAGSYPRGASYYGVMDMAGNVIEWVADWYQSDYYSQEVLENPTGPASGQFRGQRGGSWLRSQESVRISVRSSGLPPNHWLDFGFRCAYSKEQP